MRYWDKHPGNFRIVMILLAAIFVTLSGINLYRAIISPTDENAYTPVIKTFYITKAISALTADDKEPIEIPRGSWLIRSSRYNYNSEEKLDSLFAVSGSFARLKVYNPYLMAREEVLIPTNESVRERLRFISTGAVIISITPGGNSDKAGLEVGDLILKVNGHDFDDIINVERILHSSIDEGVVDYLVMRGDEMKNFTVEVVRFGVNFDLLYLFLSSLIMMGLGLFLAIARPRISSARVTAFGFILVGNFISSGIINADMSMDIFSLLRLVLIGGSLYIGIPVIIKTLYLIPTENKRILEKSWIMKVNFTLGTIGFLAVAIVILLGKNMFLFSIIGLWVVLLTIFFNLFIRIRYRKLFDKQSLRKGRFLRWSYYIVLAVYFIFPNWHILGLPPIFRYGYVLILLIPMALVYTIAKYSLFNFNFRVRRSIRFVTVTFLVNILIVAATVFTIIKIAGFEYSIPNLHFNGTTIVYVDRPLSYEKNHHYEKILVVILSLIVIAMAYKLSGAIGGFFGRAFFRKKINYKSAAGQFQRMIENNLSTDDLATEIVKKLQELLNLKRAGTIFFKDETVVWGQAYLELIDINLREYVSLASERLVEAIKPFSSASEIDYLPEPLKNIFVQCDFKIFVPIRSKDKVIGVLLLGEKLSEDAFSNDELEFLSTIASQISISVDNALLYEDLAQQERIKHELKIARQIQLASLPTSIPEEEGFDIHGVSIPAMEVGGDFYDFLISDKDSLTVIIGDVSGKGTSASLYMSKIQGILRTLNEYNLYPRELLIKSNKLLFHYIEKNSFITSIALRINKSSNTFHISRAGHLPILKYDAQNGSIMQVQPRGMALGITGGNIFDNNIAEEISNYKPGDVFLLFTDGITEARNARGEEFGINRVKSFLKINHNMRASEISQQLIADVNAFGGQSSSISEQYDDLTIVTIKILDI